jgi:hypothetical protein
MTDGKGSNLVIACCPLDVWREQRRLFSQEDAAAICDRLTDSEHRAGRFIRAESRNSNNDRVTEVFS